MNTKSILMSLCFIALSSEAGATLSCGASVTTALSAGQRLTLPVTEREAVKERIQSEPNLRSIPETKIDRLLKRLSTTKRGRTFRNEAELERYIDHAIRSALPREWMKSVFQRKQIHARDFAVSTRLRETLNPWIQSRSLEERSTMAIAREAIVDRISKIYGITPATLRTVLESSSLISPSFPVPDASPSESLRRYEIYRTKESIGTIVGRIWLISFLITMGEELTEVLKDTSDRLKKANAEIAYVSDSEKMLAEWITHYKTEHGTDPSPTLQASMKAIFAAGEPPK